MELFSEPSKVMSLCSFYTLLPCHPLHCDRSDLSVTGAYQGFRNGFVLYGTKGTLQLDFTTKKLTLGLKEDGTQIRAAYLKIHEPPPPLLVLY